MLVLIDTVSFQKMLMAGGQSTSDFNKPSHGLKVLLYVNYALDKTYIIIASSMKRLFLKHTVMCSFLGI